MAGMLEPGALLCSGSPAALGIAQVLMADPGADQWGWQRERCPRKNASTQEALQDTGLFEHSQPSLAVVWSGWCMAAPSLLRAPVHPHRPLPMASAPGFMANPAGAIGRLKCWAGRVAVHTSSSEEGGSPQSPSVLHQGGGWAGTATPCCCSCL